MNNRGEKMTITILHNGDASVHGIYIAGGANPDHSQWKCNCWKAPKSCEHLRALRRYQKKYPNDFRVPETEIEVRQ